MENQEVERRPPQEQEWSEVTGTESELKNYQKTNTKQKPTAPEAVGSGELGVNLLGW